jgi:hypothetical protein
VHYDVTDRWQRLTTAFFGFFLHVLPSSWVVWKRTVKKVTLYLILRLFLFSMSTHGALKPNIRYTSLRLFVRFWPVRTSGDDEGAHPVCKVARSGQSSFPYLETCGVRKWEKTKEKTQGKRLAFVFMARELNE